jgi:hypothetical protein
VGQRKQGKLEQQLVPQIQESIKKLGKKKKSTKRR